MYQFILRRLLLSIPTLLIVSFLIFGMIRLNPDSVVAARLGEGYTPEQAEQIKEEYGLNNPLATEYVSWLGRVVRGDWGESAYTSQSVLSEMGPKILVTFELAFLAIIIAVVVGVPGLIGWKPKAPYERAFPRRRALLQRLAHRM